jgi:pimeloyl-ACP methyl ester carboxylesterase
MSDLYVLVHGAWHTGAHLEAVAGFMRAAGHTVHCPTLAGNREGDDRSRAGLEDAVKSLAEYLETHDLQEVRLVGHSYAGMVISAIADRFPGRLKRLVYANAFVPLDGECLLDLTPPAHAAKFEEAAKAYNNALMLPFEVWRETFINDADITLARSTYEQLNAQPYGTFTEKIRLSRPLAEMAIGKSYLNCQQDTAMPHHFPWHPRLSARLGLFRLVECPGSHETWLSNPARLAQAVIEAGRD